MANYENQPRYGGAVARGADVAIDAGLRAHMLRVYNYMTIGLVLTGVAAYVVVNTNLRDLFFDFGVNGAGLTALGWIAFIAPLPLVMVLSFGIQRMSVGTAQLVFWGYAIIMGISLSPILLLYTGASVAKTFFITAATFGSMSLWGYTTKTDLTGMGRFLIMGVIGLVIKTLEERLDFVGRIILRFVGIAEARLVQPHSLCEQSKDLGVGPGDPSFRSG